MVAGMTTNTRLALAAVAALSILAAPGRATAQVSATFQLELPFTPHLVVVEPGIQVVESYNEEVFVVGGAWWVRRGPVWYRAPRPGGHFVPVRVEHVPPGLVRLPPGRYKNYKKAMKEERKERHEEEKAFRKMGHDEKGHKHGKD
jgi:hypothetical protein